MSRKYLVQYQFCVMERLKQYRATKKLICLLSLNQVDLSDHLINRMFSMKELKDAIQVGLNSSSAQVGIYYELIKHLDEIVIEILTLFDNIWEEKHPSIHFLQHILLGDTGGGGVGAYPSIFR